MQGADLWSAYLQGYLNMRWLFTAQISSCKITNKILDVITRNAAYFHYSDSADFYIVFNITLIILEGRRSDIKLRITLNVTVWHFIERNSSTCKRNTVSNFFPTSVYQNKKTPSRDSSLEDSSLNQGLLCGWMEFFHCDRKPDLPQRCTVKKCL